MSEKPIKPFYKSVDGLCVPGFFSTEAVRSAIRYKPQKDDFFVVTFPKCGTTWMQQIVSLIFDKGKSVTTLREFRKRTPFLEMYGADATDLMKKPGSIKIHLPYNLTPYSLDAKYLYITRNPKDTVVSFYHHTHTLNYRFKNGSFDDFFEVFMQGENDFGDYFDHVLSWYGHRNDPNVLFLTYEELKLDTPSTVKRIAGFMGQEYLKMLENDPGVFSNVLKYSSLEHMKFLNKVETVDDIFKNLEESLPSGLRHVMEHKSKIHADPTDQTFEIVRKGIVGEGRTVLTDEQSQRLDEKIKEELGGTDLLNFWKSIKCI